MRIFSDFKLFERPPKPGPSLFRYIAWRWLAFGTLFIAFTTLFAAMHYLGGEPIYYTNEHRNMSDNEVREFLALFFPGVRSLLFLVWLVYSLFPSLRLSYD